MKYFSLLLRTLVHRICHSLIIQEFIKTLNSLTQLLTSLWKERKWIEENRMLSNENCFSIYNWSLPCKHLFSSQKSWPHFDNSFKIFKINGFSADFCGKDKICMLATCNCLPYSYTCSIILPLGDLIENQSCLYTIHFSSPFSCCLCFH